MVILLFLGLYLLLSVSLTHCSASLFFNPKYRKRSLKILLRPPSHTVTYISHPAHNKPDYSQARCTTPPKTVITFSTNTSIAEGKEGANSLALDQPVEQPGPGCSNLLKAAAPCVWRRPNAHFLQKTCSFLLRKFMLRN